MKRIVLTLALATGVATASPAKAEELSKEQIAVMLVNTAKLIGYHTECAKLPARTLDLIDFFSKINPAALDEFIKYVKYTYKQQGKELFCAEARRDFPALIN